MNFPFRPLLAAVALCTASTLSLADTLAEIYQLALKNDPTLKAAEATYRSDIEFERQALSTIVPQISGTASYGEQDIDTIGFNQETLGSNETTRESDQTSYKISVFQNLFDLSAWFYFKQGKEISLQAQAQLAADQQDLIVRVASAYFDVLSAQDNLRASQAEERATKRQLEQTQQRFDVGLIAITEVHEAQAVFDGTVVRRLTDEGALGTAFEALTVLTGESHSNLWELNKDFPIVDPDPLARDEWVKFALKNNYNLKVALHAMEGARHNATAKRMSHAPTVTASYQYSDDENNTDLTGVGDGILDSQTDGSAWRVELTVPIFSGGLTSSQRRQAHEQYNGALQNQIGTQRNVIRNTRASHINVATDVQRVKARKQSIVSTRSALDATQAGYEVGTRNIVDVLQAQRSLYFSIRDYANSRYGYVINMMLLKQAAGTLSPEDIIDISKWMVAGGSTSANDMNSIR
jgi:outer membrane protein